MICMLAVGLISCSDLSSEITLGEYRVTYRANVERGLWYGSYTDAQGNSICVCEAPLLPDGWMHSFATSELPTELSFVVTSEFYADSTVVDKPDVTGAIFLNGQLLISQTNLIGDGKTKVSASLPFDGTSGSK
jgi:hypothetical protein